MATIVIEPVSVHTRDGSLARIKGICPTDHDCLHGEVITADHTTTPARWNLSGIRRDGHDGHNLDMRENETSELADTARRLGAG